MTTEKKSSNNITVWLAEHPTLKLIGSLVAIIGGLISIITFLSGASSFPSLWGSWSGKYYDRFENPMYDGRFDTTLWERGGLSGVSIEQRDGALVLQPVNVTEGDNVALFPRKLKTIPFQKFEGMEAKLKLSGSVTGTGFVKIQAYTIHNNLAWWLECQVESMVPGSAVYWCNVEEGAYNGNTPVPAYETDPITVNFDQWYLSRFELDSDHKQVRFYLDHKLVGEYTIPEDTELYFSVIETQIGSWVHPTNQFVGYFDDVRIDVER